MLTIDSSGSEIMKGNKPRAAQKRNQEGKQARRQGGSGSQEQPKREIRKGDKLGRQGMEIMKGDKLGRQGGSGGQEQPRMEIMKGDKVGEKAAAASRPFGDFGDQQPSHWEVRTPIASSFLGNYAMGIHALNFRKDDLRFLFFT